MIFCCVEEKLPEEDKLSEATNFKTVFYKYKKNGLALS